jgi:hypothetical protein
VLIPCSLHGICGRHALTCDRGSVTTVKFELDIATLERAYNG